VRSFIDELSDEEHTVHSDSAEIKDIVLNSFATVSSSSGDLVIREIRDKIQDYTQPKVLESMNNSLYLPYTKEEVGTALKQMHPHKASSLDG